MSDTSSKIVVGPKLLKPVPKVSFGKFIFDRLKRGIQDAVALVDAHTGSTVTYGQILERSVKLAYHFRRHNVQKGEVIAILSENDINYIIPVIAALYVGAIVHHLNVNLSLEEMSGVFRVSQPKWIFSSESGLTLAVQLKAQFQCLQTIITFGAKTEDANSLEELLLKHVPNLGNFEPHELNPEEDVAQIFNSSGTSGLPKCVMLTHYNMVFAIDVEFGHKDLRNIQQGDTLLLPVPLTHIYGFIYIIGTLVALGKCVVMKKFAPELYLKSIELYRVTKISCPPLILNFLAQSELVEKYDISSILDITCGSAPSEPDMYLIIKKRFNVLPRQVYGTTETAAAFTFIPPIDVLSKLGSCGILLQEHIIKICNVETQEILGFNQPGEICIKGPLVMKGYMGSPEETKNSIDNDGFYHTGDIGYYDQDKYFFIIDRLKDLIKYKGFQVSPIEVENVILKHNAIAEAAVIGVPDERSGEVPLAYVVIKETYDTNITESEIVEFVAERISVNKRLYGGVKFIKEIPKNKNGKVLKRTLRELYNKSLIE